MKTLNAVLKVLTALAAVAGAVYVVATYGEKIVEWARKIWANMPKYPCCEEADFAEETPAEESAEDAPEIEVEIVVEEPAEAAETAEADAPAETAEESTEEPAEESAPEVTAPVAEDADFEA